MKKYIAILVALCFACGSPDEEFVEGTEYIGTAKQRIFMPFHYGIEGLNNSQGHPDFGLQCDGSTPSQWADFWCSVPDSKTIKIGFQAATCNSDWQGAAVDAWNDWKYEVEAQGWTVVVGNDFQIKCKTGTPNFFGRFLSGPSWDKHIVPQGTLGQYKNGTVELYPTGADAWTVGFLPANRQLARINIIKHELYHVVGLGHSQHGAGSDLMSEQPNGTWLSEYKDLGNTRRAMLDCYNQNSGTGDDC